MKIYMLRNDKTGEWYKRNSHWIEWVEQSKGSCWSSIQGPNAAKGRIKRRYRTRIDKMPKMTIVEFEIVSTGVEL